MRVKSSEMCRRAPFPLSRPRGQAQEPPCPSLHPSLVLNPELSPQCWGDVLLEPRELICPHESIALITWWGWNLKSVPKCSALRTHLCFALGCNTQFSESRDASFCAGISHYHLDSPRAIKEEGILRFKRIFKSMGPLGMWFFVGFLVFLGCFLFCFFFFKCYLQAKRNKRAKEDSNQPLSHTRSTTKSTFIFNLVLSHKN